MEKTDPELIAAALAGDTGAFDALMRRYEKLVYRVAHGFTHGREDALDLTQISFLKAFRSLDGYRSEAGFKTWLLRIVYHEGLNWNRTRSRRGSESDLAEAEAGLAVDPSQERELVERERRGTIGRALSRIHARYRAAILLRYVDEMPIREIATVLDCSETMTKNLLFRGVRQLRRAVESGA